jgi:hypothetical protein
MHHIALCTPCITHFNCDHLLHIRVDHVEPKTKNQVEQVQWAFGDPQASSCEEARIVVIKASPGASNNILEFCYNCILIMILACALGYMS